MQRQSQLGTVLVISLFANIFLNNATMWLQIVFVPICIAVLLLTISQDGINHKQAGLTLKHAGRGLIYGLTVMLLVLASFYLAYKIWPTLFADQRYNQSLHNLLIALLVVLPIRTVLFEEFLFRGVYYAYFKNLQKLYVYLIPSLLFGLWHILPSLGFKAITIPVFNFVVPQSLSSLGTIALTAVAGAGLMWLRIKSKSLIASVIAHYAVNATGMVLAFFYFK